MKTRFALLGFVIGAVVVCAPMCAQESDLSGETEFRVRLLSPISTETSHKGDRITAEVIEPAVFRSEQYYLEGKVKESKSGNKYHGKSVLAFYFYSLQKQNGTGPIHIDSSIKSVMNSRHEQDVDEEGQVIEKKNNLPKVALATGAGALVGGLLGGGKGAAIGAGIGAAAALVLIEVSVEANNVSFGAGSEFIMSVKKHEGRQAQPHESDVPTKPPFAKDDTD